MYCASFLRASTSPARTRTLLCTEKPLWRQASMLADSRSPMAPSAASSLSTSERNPCSSSFTGTAGNATKIAALQEAIDDALFEQPLQPPLGSQFGHVAIGALVERARA